MNPEVVLRKDVDGRLPGIHTIGHDLPVRTLSDIPALDWLLSADNCIPGGGGTLKSVLEPSLATRPTARRCGKRPARAAKIF